MFLFDLQHFVVSFKAALLEIIQIEALRKHDQHQRRVALPVDGEQLAVRVGHRLLAVLVVQVDRLQEGNQTGDLLLAEHPVLEVQSAFEVEVDEIDHPIVQQVLGLYEALRFEFVE